MGFSVVPLLRQSPLLPPHDLVHNLRIALDHLDHLHQHVRLLLVGHG
jgi:hypothetical protein